MNEEADGEDNVAPVVPPRNKHTRHTQSENVDTSQVEPQVEAPKKKHLLKSIFQKMNCFFIDKQDSDFKAYRKHKQQNRNIRAIMTKLELPCAESSEEVSENTFKSKNTYWLGDDASSLGSFWPGNDGASGSGQAPGDGEATRFDDFGHDSSFV